jgi:hypothetical protein
MGKVIEIASGLTADDRVIDAPPDGLTDGDQVRIASTGDSGTATAASDGPKKTLIDTPVTKARNEQRRGKAAL